MDVEYKHLHGWLDHPTSGTGAGMLLLPTIAGVNQSQKDLAAELARAGFTALVADPYSHQPPVADLKEALQRSRSLRDETSLAEESTWLTYLFEEVGVRSAGIIGWCLGGRTVFLLAARDSRVSACVAYHPSIEDPVPPNMELDVMSLVPEIRCPIQVQYPGRDHITSRATFERLRAALDRGPGPVDVQIYPEADHAFMSTAQLAKPANAEAARLAWPQTLAFLTAALSL